ncbi:hypothetical protein EHM69_02370 [candidate division KSB1 bacterium]|nr:MAG: hypothetical protein EHM69_02370 [candidate division KSB1 bacterium]
MNSESVAFLTERLLKNVDGCREGRMDAEAFLQEAENLLGGLPLYPARTITEVGTAVGEKLDALPAVAVDLTLRLMGSTERAVRAMTVAVIARLARYQPGMWVETALHLINDDDWEVRDLAAHIFDTPDAGDGAADFHLQFVCDTVTDWVINPNERIRRAASHALLRYAVCHAEFRPRWLDMLDPLITDTSEYVRFSLVSALRTLGRADGPLVLNYMESALNRLTDESREVFRLTLDHAFTAKYPERKSELLARL